MRISPWRDDEDHERVEGRLNELEKNARAQAIRLKRIEVELGIFKPAIRLPEPREPEAT